MSYNVPSHTEKRFSFGPGILYMGALGTTPLIDIGAVKGDAEVSITRTALEMKQGSPQTLVKKYAVEEIVNLKINGVEWNLDNISYVLGAGITSISGASEIMDFGGDVEYSTRALRYVHRTPDGGTIDLHLFKTEGAGELGIALKETDFHEFPYEFNVMEGSLDFEGAALADKKKKFRVKRTPK